MDSDFDKFSEAIKAVTSMEWTKDVAKDMSSKLQDAIQKNLNWTTNLKNSVKVSANGEDVVIAMPLYGWVIEKGRGPNKKMPPVSVIESWCKSKSIPVEAAFPIARSIGKKGIKAKPFIAKSMQDVVANSIADAIKKAFISNL